MGKEFLDKFLLAFCMLLCLGFYWIDTRLLPDFDLGIMYSIVILVASLSRDYLVLGLFTLVGSALIILGALVTDYNGQLAHAFWGRFFSLWGVGAMAFLSYRIKKISDLKTRTASQLQERTRELESSRHTALGMMEDARLAAQKAHQAEEKFKMVFEAAPNGMLMLNRQGDIELVNSMVEKLFGYTRHDLVNQSMDKLVPSLFRQKGKKEFFIDLQPQALNVEENLYGRRKDGSEFPVEISLNPIQTGHEDWVLAAVGDITDRKLTEEILKRDTESLKKLVDQRSRELVNTQKELKQASRLADIGTLAATVAHELRNPLGVIQMATYNLKRKREGLLEDKHLINIEKKVWEGNQIINNLLTYSRIKIPSYEKVDVIQFLDECLSNTQIRFADYQIIFEKDYQNDLGFMEVDPHQVKEILFNILNNACQALPQKSGKVELIARRHGLQELSFTCKDNGQGIAEEDLEKVFTPFFTNKSKGTGLGLSICNELIHLHHGKIEIKSQSGKGTAVTIILPSSPCDTHS